MLRAVAAIGRATGDIDDAAPAFAAEMQHGEPAQLGGGGKIDLHRPRPPLEPFILVQLDRGGFEYAGIVDQHIDPAMQPLECRLPKLSDRLRRGEVGGDFIAVSATAAVTDQSMATQGFKDRAADAAAGARDENMEGPAHARRIGAGNLQGKRRRPASAHDQSLVV
jgi:hypothetical protein